MGHFRPLFLYFIFSIKLKVNKCSIKKFANDWIRISDLWYWKRPLSQLSHNHCPIVFLKKWANPGLFSIYFRSFQKNNTIFTTNQCEKMSCPSSIWHRDSNPRPLEHESPPITTRPGLPPTAQLFVISLQTVSMLPYLCIQTQWIEC